MVKTFVQYLTEDKEGKNLHLTHIEDSVLTDGIKGTRAAIYFLASLRDMLAGHSPRTKLNLTTKFDGAPAIFAGINPSNGKFFVGTKGVFAQNAKLNYTEADIDANHPSDGLRNKLKTALRYLPELGISGVIQGDMMFSKGDLKDETFEGHPYITFQPNTIVYAVPAESDLAKRMKAAQMGIVWHTSYVGPTLEDMKASFGVDIARLKQTRNVWFRDATFVDASGTATLSFEETRTLNAVLNQIGTTFRQINSGVLNEVAHNDTYRIQIMTYNNSKVREGQTITDTAAHTKGLIQWVENKLNLSIQDAKKQDTRLKRQQEKNIVMGFYLRNKEQLKLIFDLQNLMVQAKLILIRKMETIRGSLGTFMRADDGGLKVTPEEGFVAVDVLKGNAVKLVDRLTFSKNNFDSAKAWSK